MIGDGETNKLTLGDYFIHVRTGARFICRAVTRYDDKGTLFVKAEIEPQEIQPQPQGNQDTPRPQAM